MRFLVDASVDVRVAAWLRAQGHEVVHLSEVGQQGLTGEEVFQKAARENPTVVTFDLDFSEIAALTRSRLVSVLVLPLWDTRFHHVIDRLLAVLPAAERALESGAIVSVEETRY